jgi:multidrug efflux system outer membrane protein
MKRLVVLIGLAAGTTGCMLGPDYETPVVETPERFDQSVKVGESIANVEWWELFEDPNLRELINLALEENKELAIAVSRIEEARARYGFTRADLLPKAEAGAAVGRGNPFGAVIPGASTIDTYSISARASWEIDLFGKLRRSNEAARAELLATEDARRVVTIVLIADVASNYLLLRDFDTRLDISRRTLESRTKSLELVTARFDKGTVPLIDVNQAQIQEADAAAQIAFFERAVIETENLLNILIGRNPETILHRRTAQMQLAPPEVPAGLPSELLERRPDIRQASQALAAQTARVGIAEALRFPSLTLTGTLGVASNDLGDLTTSDSKIWNIGASFFGPIYNAGKNKRRVEIEVARTEQALKRYELSVLQAFREVEDALAGIRTFHDETVARQRQVTAARSARTLSGARYDGGVTSYLEVLESDRSLFTAELSESSVRREQLVSYVELYKALGGGWIRPDPEVSD